MTPGFSAQAGDRLGVPMRPSLSRGAAQLGSWPGWRIPAPAIDDHWRPRGGMAFAHQRRSSRGERRRDLQHGTPVDKPAS